jgi:hypothetical protein
MNTRIISASLFCAGLLCLALSACTSPDTGNHSSFDKHPYLQDQMYDGQPRTSSYLPPGDVGANNPN